MEPEPNKDPPILIKKPYRCRPTLNQAIIISSQLVQLNGTTLQFFDIKEYTLIHSMDIIEKEAQYCAKLVILSN